MPVAQCCELKYVLQCRYVVAHIVWHTETHLAQFVEGQLGFCGTIWWGASSSKDSVAHSGTNPVWLTPIPLSNTFFLLTFSLLGLQAFQYNPSLACSVSGSISICYPLSHSRRSIAIGGINRLPLEHVPDVDNPSSDNGAETYYTKQLKIHRAIWKYKGY